MYRSWPSQANHIFSRLQIKSNFEDYMYVAGVSFRVEIGPSDTTKRPPEGFLFLCPPTDFQTASSSLCWPDFPAYWSLDPQGAERLSMKDATQLGFPSIVLITEIRGYSWDKSVYAGLRQFHQAKGFDPDSQEVARYLGESLYQISPGTDVPFAYVDDEDSYSEKNEQHSVINIDDESGETQSLAGEGPASDGPNLSTYTAPTEKSDENSTFTTPSKITEARDAGPGAALAFTPETKRFSYVFGFVSVAPKLHFFPEWSVAYLF
ncbi:hypothetical protein B0H19DRAFT_1261558 [Mycena capillaripes]|nr:hypothetical protein B0H19DRAFT_1261558 [Mycena capillaripes]